MWSSHLTAGSLLGGSRFAGGIAEGRGGPGQSCSPLGTTQCTGFPFFSLLFLEPSALSHPAGNKSLN